MTLKWDYKASSYSLQKGFKDHPKMPTTGRQTEVRFTRTINIKIPDKMRNLSRYSGGFRTQGECGSGAAWLRPPYVTAQLGSESHK
jgi:hypothetical protein